MKGMGKNQKDVLNEVFDNSVETYFVLSLSASKASIKISKQTSEFI